MLFVSIVRCHLVGALECSALTKPEVAQLERLQNVLIWKLYCAQTRRFQQPRDFADRPTAEALRVWLQVPTVESQLVVSRVNWLVDSINHGPTQFEQRMRRNVKKICGTLITLHFTQL